MSLYKKGEIYRIQGNVVKCMDELSGCTGCCFMIAVKVQHTCQLPEDPLCYAHKVIFITPTPEEVREFEEREGKK